MDAIVAQNVTKRYPLPDGGARTALRNVSLRVARGEFVCLLGPSGCGKTTLLNILGGLDRDHEGSVRYGAGPSAEAPVVSYMFQQSRLLPWLTVAQNLEFVLDGPRKARRELIGHWLERVGLSGYGNDFPSRLSTGMQQRVAVARALIIAPDILFMDEPFSSLDELTALRMRQELLELWAEQRCTVVFVTHNPMEAAFLADRVVVMAASPGQIIAEMDVTKRLPRPRTPDDLALWTLAREAIRLLGSEAAPTTGTASR